MTTPADPPTDSLAMEFELSHAPEKVWRALTEPDLLTRWLLPVVGLRLQPEAPFSFQAPPRPGWDGVVHCRFLAIEPLRKLSYTWDVGEMRTVVTFTLTPTTTGTRLSLRQEGFTPDQKRNLGGARHGWTMMTGKLVELLAQVP